MDPDIVEQVRVAIEESPRIDARHIEVDATNGRVVLVGAVATPEESSAASLLAENFAGSVDNRLRVDRGLREGGPAEPAETEPAQPVENEILIGDPDMLAGPEAKMETDLARAAEENVPWDPPEEPHLAPTAREYGGDVSEGAPDAGPRDDDAETPARRSAPDLTRDELGLPSERVAPPESRAEAPNEPAVADPAGVDQFGRTPPESMEPQVDRLPDAAAGTGATGEGTQGGGSTGGVPATETGARGADTTAADPVRSTGKTASDAGTERGPQAREDEPVREDFPDRQPPGDR